jgi:hypothetical protein
MICMGVETQSPAILMPKCVVEAELKKSVGRLRSRQFFFLGQPAKRPVNRAKVGYLFVPS